MLLGPLLLLSTTPPAVAGEAAAPPAANAPFWTGHPDGEAFRAIQEGRLARARELVSRIVAVKGKRTVENTLRPYDDALLELDAAGSQSLLMENVHPDSSVRAAAEKASREVSAFSTELSLNRDVYDALAAVDLSGADAETRYYVKKTLRDFRLAGVDRDPAVRDSVQRLNDELVAISQAFERNIRGGRRSVTVDDTTQLAGLPEDYIARKKPGPDGKITITTDYPDALPVFSYADNEDLRRRLYMEFNNRAYPENMKVLDELLEKRNALATLLGFKNWADYVTADKMVGSAGNASGFIDRVVAASGKRAELEYRQLLAFKRRHEPGATVVTAWESGYWSEKLRKAEYDFDAQSVRPYFPFAEVKQGVLDVTSRLFGVTYRRVEDAPVWDPSVECWEMYENGRLVGRFYFDLHPRKDKYSHAAQFDVRTGLEGRQIPEAALVCNFPGGEPDDPGLMEYGDVRTFFHEFGHLLHTLFAGHHEWIGTGGIRTEHDFVEAPSQMLEEWTRDPATLASFARHYRTGEPIPAALVQRMDRAEEFGKGLRVRRQMVYARISLSCYDRDPTQVDTDSLVARVTREYQPYPFVPGTHLQCAFGHLDGYSAVYYTYMWSLVIAKDMFSKFNRRDLLSPGVATRYRDAVLAPGGSAPAAELVEHFLGRPFNFKAWQAWLEQDPDTSP